MSQTALRVLEKDATKINANHKIALKEQSLSKQDHQNKFKTELCRNLEAGFCEFGENCFFAHNLDELRKKNKQIVPKNIKCKNFFELKYCISGANCQFSHKENSTETDTNSPYASTKASRKGSDEASKFPVFIELEYRSFF